jgi:hypothetical protein
MTPSGGMSMSTDGAGGMGVALGVAVGDSDGVMRAVAGTVDVGLAVAVSGGAVAVGVAVSSAVAVRVAVIGGAVAVGVAVIGGAVPVGVAVAGTGVMVAEADGVDTPMVDVGVRER